MSDGRRRSATGWGYEGEGLGEAEVAELVRLVAARFPRADLRVRSTVPAAPVPPARLTVPSALTDVCSVEGPTRHLHAVGRSYADVVAAARGTVTAVPDVVAEPRDAGEVAAVLDWCAETGAACIPFGGGTSVVGGVNPPGDVPVVTLQTRSMGAVLEVDPVSRAARIQAGAVGPAIEEQLRPAGLTLRFFPQSFELSTLGGWIATRAAGHYATRLTRIDDLVQSVTAVTPVGLWEGRRFPSSGAGPSPERLLLGSEGTLGVVTEAWVRLQDRPVHREGASVRFPDLGTAAAAVRTLVQSGLEPANCRILDPVEALLAGAGDGSAAVVVLGFESAHRPVSDQAESALALCRDQGGTVETSRGDVAGAWRRAFTRAPYLRDALIAHGVMVETFETAVTWDRFHELIATVLEVTGKAVTDICGDGIVSCRLTHVYPDGAAPYFTVLAPARDGAEAAQWRGVKAAATEALVAAGGTITHHHAVGRDHRRWYDRERPDPFALALTAAKRALDPSGILSPGVLI